MRRRRVAVDGRPTVMQVAVDNVGTLRAGAALGYLVTWAWGVQRYGPEMTPGQYAEMWLCSRATAYRHRRLILDAFDGRDVELLLQLVAEATAGVEHRTQRQAVKASATVAGLAVPA